MTSKKNFTGNPTAQAVEQRIDKIRSSQWLADLKDVMSTAAGRRVMYSIIFNICHIEALSYTGNSDTYLKEGERNAGLTLFNELQDKHTESFMEMMIEAMATRRDELVKRRTARETAETEE